MRKNLFLMMIIGLFLTVSTSFAQQNADNFLGKWKLDLSQNKWAVKSGVESMRLDVSKTEGELVIERDFEKLDSTVSSTRKEIYKINESSITSVIGGQFGGVKWQWLRFYKNNKLELFSKLNGEYFVTSTSEKWNLSEDGKTLTIRHGYQRSSLVASEGNSYAYNSAKMVFTRE